MREDHRLEVKNNSILIDIELHGNILLLPIYNETTNIYDILTYQLDDEYTKQDRDVLLRFFESNKIYAFKEGKFLDALFSDENFDEDDDFFKLNVTELRNLKKQFSSNANWMVVNYLEGLPFFKTYNFIPAPAGDLKVIAFKLNNNLKQKHSTFSTYDEALNYCRVNIKMIYELYKYAIIESKDVGLLHSQNCYGTIVNNNGVGIISPRILGEYGMWINSNYYYIKLKNPATPNIDIKQKIRHLATGSLSKYSKIELFLTEIKKHGELI